MPTALVTGSEGFIGRHMCAELARRDYDVECCDIKSGNDARVLFANSEVRYDLIVHCAAHVGGRADIDRKPLYIGAVNLQLDGGLFEYALRTKPGRVVYYSSSAAYPVFLQEGANIGRRLTEDDISYYAPELPDASYGMVKLVGEQLAAMAQGSGLNVSVFRPFSGYGADQDLSYPWPAIMSRAKLRNNPFTIWGDGKQVRDWIHVDDVIQGTLACVEADVTTPVNLCTGIGVDFTQLATWAGTAVGYHPKFDYKLDAPRGVTYRVGDPTLLNDVYTPKVSVHDGIARVFSKRRHTAA